MDCNKNSEFITSAFGVIIFSEKISSNEMSFQPDYPIYFLSDSPIKFVRESPCVHSLLARQLFDIKEVVSVILTRSRINVQINETVDISKIWQKVLEKLYFFLTSEVPAVTPCQSGAQHYHDNDGLCVTIPQQEETEAAIEDLINKIIRPVVLDENGDFIFKSFDKQSGVVKVVPFGTCKRSSNAFSTIREATLSLLQFYIPEVVHVEYDSSNILEESYLGKY